MSKEKKVKAAPDPVAEKEKDIAKLEKALKVAKLELDIEKVKAGKEEVKLPDNFGKFIPNWYWDWYIYPYTQPYISPIPPTYPWINPWKPNYPYIGDPIYPYNQPYTIYTICSGSTTSGIYNENGNQFVTLSSQSPVVDDPIQDSINNSGVMTYSVTF